MRIAKWIFALFLFVNIRSEFLQGDILYTVVSTTPGKKIYIEGTKYREEIRRILSEILSEMEQE